MPYPSSPPPPSMPGKSLPTVAIHICHNEDQPKQLMKKQKLLHINIWNLKKIILIYAHSHRDAPHCFDRFAMVAVKSLGFDWLHLHSTLAERERGAFGPSTSLAFAFNTLHASPSYSEHEETPGRKNIHRAR